MRNAFLNFGKSFLTDLKTILLALVIAVTSWFAISFQLFPTLEKEIIVPISTEPTAIMRDMSLELAEDFDQTLQVTVLGKRVDVGRLDADSFRVYLDFTPVTSAGNYDLDVVVKPIEENKYDIVTPPTKQTVRIIQTDEKNMSISAAVDGVAVVEGMTIDDENVAITPARVLVWGEKSLIDSIYSAQVIPINDGTPISSNTVFQGELALYDRTGNLIDSEDLHIEERLFSVIIPVSKRKTIPLDVDFINVPNNFDRSLLETRRVYPSDLVMASPDDSIDNIDIWSLGAISLSDITLNDVRNGMNIDITLPVGYKNVSGETRARLDFDVEGYGEMAFRVPRTNFTPINHPSNFDIDFVTRQINVRVVGPSDVIRSMTADDIRGTINFAGISDIALGERSIGIKFNVAGQDVRAWVIGEYKIDIRIVERSN